MKLTGRRLSQPGFTAGAVGLACALSLAPLGSLFRGFGFLGPGIVAVALIVAGGELARITRLPAALGPLFGAAGVLGLLTALYGRRGAHLAVIPGGRSLHALAVTAAAGFTDLRSYAAPAPTTHGLLLLVIAGSAGVTLVTYLLASTLEVPAATGLPLLVFFLLATALAPHGTGMIAFCCVAGGYLFLLATTTRAEQLRWGRMVRGPARGPAGWPSTGVRIGGVTLVLALVVPGLVPGLHARRLSHGDGLSTRPGRDTQVTFNPILTLGEDLDSSTAIPLMVVRSSDAEPHYLQLTVLDKFTAGSWVASRDLQAGISERVDRASFPRPPAGIPARPVNDRITLQGTLDVHWLPVPFPLTGVRISGDWRYDAGLATVFSAAETTQDVSSYRVSSLHLQPSAAELAAATGRPAPPADVALPPGMPAVIHSIALGIVAGRRGELARAVAIQDYLTGPLFHYSTSVPDLDGISALVSFLTVSHTGYCVQFAAAMAVLARSVGIPARVAVGFTGGTLQPGGSWLITTQDAHAWPELYFPGVGWLRFEPTPRGDGQAVIPAYAQAGPGSSGPGSPASTPGGGVVTSPSPTAKLTPPLLRLAHSNGAPGAVAHHHRAPVWPVPAGVGLLVALAALGPGGVRLARRYRRARVPAGAGRVEARWAELADTARDLGMGWAATDSPRRAAGAMAAASGLDPGARAALDELVKAVEIARYAPPGAALPAGGAELRTLVRTLQRLAGPKRRWRARLLPASVLLRPAGQR